MKKFKKNSFRYKFLKTSSNFAKMVENTLRRRKKKLTSFLVAISVGCSATLWQGDVANEKNNNNCAPHLANIKMKLWWVKWIWSWNLLVALSTFKVQCVVLPWAAVFWTEQKPTRFKSLLVKKYTYTF